MENKKNSFNIEKLISAVISRWYIPVICIVLAVSAAFFYAKFMTQTMYSAYTTIYITENVASSDNNKQKTSETAEITVNEKLAQDYKVIATSNRVLDKVRAALPGATVDAAQISVSAYTGTRILNFSVKHPDPELAAKIANEITKVMIDEVNDIIRKDNITVIDNASVPTEPVPSNTKVFIILAVIAGIVISVLIILLIEIFDTKVKSPEDFKNYFDLPIIGVIPHYDTEDTHYKSGGSDSDA